jgi:hypothetical protein
MQKNGLKLLIAICKQAPSPEYKSSLLHLFFWVFEHDLDGLFPLATLGIYHWICGDPEDREWYEKLLDSPFFDYLVTSIASRDPEVVQSSLALLGLIYRMGQTAPGLAPEDVIAQIYFEVDGVLPVLKWVARALGSMVRNRDFLDEALAKGLVVAFQDVYERADFQGKAAIGGCLAEGVRVGTTAHHRDLIDAGVFRLFVELLDSGDEESAVCSLFALRVLYVAARVPGGNVCDEELESVRGLVEELAGHENPEISEEAHLLLEERDADLDPNDFQ